MILQLKKYVNKKEKKKVTQRSPSRMLFFLVLDFSTDLSLYHKKLFSYISKKYFMAIN